MHQFAASARYFYIPAVTFLWAAIAIEQTLPRRAAVAAAAGGLFGLLFFAHTDMDGLQFITTDWPATARCLATEKECVAQINPGFLGRRRVPSDDQMRTLDWQARRDFEHFPEPRPRPATGG